MGLLPDFVLDYISVTTFWTILMIVHGLLAVALLGALTHQAMSVLVPVRAGAGPGGIVTRFRAVQGAGYATAVCVLWIVTFIFGAWIYTKYRMYVRIPIEHAGLLEDAGRVRAEGAPRHHRARPAADLLVLLEERAQRRIRQRAALAHRRARRDGLVHVPGRPHRQQRAGVRLMSTATDTRPARRRRRLHRRRRSGPSRWCSAIATPIIYVDLRDAELAAVHLSPGHRPGRSGSTRRRCANEGPAMYWYGWIATTLIGSAILGILATMLPENIARKIPLSLDLDCSGGGGAGPDLRAEDSSGAGRSVESTLRRPTC